MTARSLVSLEPDTAFRDRVLALLEQPPPTGLSHWDGVGYGHIEADGAHAGTVAEALGASVYAVWRVLRREGIYL